MKRSWVGLAMLLGSCGERGDEVFTPGPPGRAAGIRAVIDIDGEQLESNEVEVVLRSVQDPEAEPESRRGRASLLGTAPTSAPDDFATPSSIAGRSSSMSEIAAASAPAAACDGGIAPGTDVTQMGTLGGRVCFTNVAYTVGALAVEDSLTTTVWFAREGIYYQADLGQSAYYPPDFGHFGVSMGTGCFVVEDDVLTTDYLGQLRTISLSFGVGPLSVGWTFYILPGVGVQRAFAYSTGYGASASLLPFPISFGFSVSTDGENLVGPRAVRGWDNECLAPLLKTEGVSYATADYNALSATADHLGRLAQAEPADYRGALMQEVARSSAPVMRMIGRPSGGSLGENLPAGTNADLFDDFLARSGSGLCTDCPNTSLDFLLTDFNDQMAAADDIEEILTTGSVTVERITQSMPQMLMQSSLQLRTAAANDLVFEVVADLAAEARGDADRYVARELKTIEIEVGAAAHLDVSAAEIASLTGIDAGVLEGATVTFDAEPRVDAASFAIEGGVAAASLTPTQAMPLLVRVEVDLSTAVGPIPEGAERWVVHPAMRLVQVVAGPPAFAYVSAPGATTSGAPIGLSAAVLDADYNVVDAPFRARFFDAEGELGGAEAVLGLAELRFVPRPSTPKIDAASAAADGVYALTGSGFSVDATLDIDGEAADTFTVERSTAIGFSVAGLGAGAHTVVVHNPDGNSSDPFTLQL